MGKEQLNDFLQRHELGEHYVYRALSIQLEQDLAEVSSLLKVVSKKEEHDELFKMKELTASALKEIYTKGY